MDIGFDFIFGMDWMVLGAVLFGSILLAIFVHVLSPKSRPAAMETVWAEDDGKGSQPSDSGIDVSLDDDIPVLTEKVDSPADCGSWESRWNDAIRRRNEAERDLELLVKDRPVARFFSEKE